MYCSPEPSRAPPPSLEEQAQLLERRGGRGPSPVRCAARTPGRRPCGPALRPPRHSRATRVRNASPVLSESSVTALRAVVAVPADAVAGEERRRALGGGDRAGEQARWSRPGCPAPRWAHFFECGLPAMLRAGEVDHGVGAARSTAASTLPALGSHRDSCAEAGSRRTRAVTSWPCTRRWSDRWVPRKPEAPAMTTRMSPPNHAPKRPRAVQPARWAQRADSSVHGPSSTTRPASSTTTRSACASAAALLVAPMTAVPRVAQRLPQLDLGGGVERGRHVVGQQHVGVGGQRPGQRESLHLPAGEAYAAVADERVGAAGLGHVAPHAGRLQRRHDRPVAGGRGRRCR